MGFPYMTITLGLYVYTVYSVCIDRATVQPRRGSDSIMKLEKWNSESIAGENMPHTLIQTHTYTHTQALKHTDTGQDIQIQKGTLYTNAQSNICHISCCVTK